ncbi:MAG: T9SS type A sorting domain-containing protein [Paludibacteraceae bacterium]|nr:T9SS type A sorting domain-containing protein [Paludibacteraceae bacterium]
MMLCAVCVASAANYLTFTAEEDSSTFGIMNEKNNPDVQYSLDGGATWTALTEGDSVILAHKGDKALLKGNNPQGFSNRGNYSFFTMTGKVSASGSVMSLIDGTGLSTEIPNGDCFYSLFIFCTSLTRAPELPATTLTAFCYNSMFLGCTSLTQVPALPATTLANGCYDGMFARCTSLTQAPALPATTLADSCYMYMFSGCTNLSEISVDFTKWGSLHTDSWVENVAPTGTFYCPKELPLEYGVDRIPEGWTVKHIEVGVNATLADNITVWTDDLTIYVRGAKGEVSIYDLSGKRVAVSYSADEERALSVPAKGVYVVRTNYGTSDVLVR